MTVWSVIVSIANWLWGIIKLPLTFDECVKLLKELNAKIDSPAQNLAQLQLFKLMYEEKEKYLNGKLNSADAQHKAEIQEMLTELKIAKEDINNLIEENKKLKQNNEVFRQALNKSETERERLNKEMEKRKLGKLNILGKTPNLSWNDAIKKVFMNNNWTYIRDDDIWSKK